MRAVGHRVVHGGRTFFLPTLIDEHVMSEIERIADLAPLHNPANLIGIRAAGQLLPDVPAVAVFDTAFFHGLPDAAATYALDRGVASLHAIRRYGFTAPVTSTCRARLPSFSANPFRAQSDRAAPG